MISYRLVATIDKVLDIRTHLCCRDGACPVSYRLIVFLSYHFEGMRVYQMDILSVKIPTERSDCFSGNLIGKRTFATVYRYIFSLVRIIQ